MLYIRVLCILMALLAMQVCGNPLGESNSIDSTFSPGGDATQPAAPTNLAFTGDAAFATSPTLTWTASTDNESVTSYKIGLGTTAGSDNIISFTDVGNVTTYQFTSINPLLILTTTYYFVVKAVDSSGNESAVATSLGWSPGLAIESNAYKLPESPTYYDSCSDYLSSAYYNNEGDGLYWLDIDGAGGNPAFIASCDMSTDSGGWTLVLNYVHQGGTSPATSTKNFSLPYISSSTLGTDESSQTANWGHGGTNIISAMSFTEVRFYCVTSGHPRVVHFKTSLSTVLSYLVNGTGTFNGIEGSNNEYIDHTANLPDSSDTFSTNQGDITLTEYPFLDAGGVFRWGIAGAATRWECDDAPGSNVNNTLHRVWIR